MTNKIGYTLKWENGEVTEIWIDPEQRGFGQITNLPLAKGVKIYAPCETNGQKKSFKAYFKKIKIYSKEDRSDMEVDE